MALNRDQYKLGPSQHQRIFERDIKPELFARAKPVGRPVAVIFGGQPGAGKSAAVAWAAHELESRGGSIQIIGDDLRAYHPHYARLIEHDDKSAAFFTDGDIGLWIEKAIAEAAVLRVNLVVEGTMRDAHKVAATMQSLRAAGYVVDARVLAVNFRLSEQGILQRYEGQKADRGYGRLTLPQAHQLAYDAIPATLERVERDKLADLVRVYRRGGLVLYTNEQRNGQWLRTPQARAVLEIERNRPMSLHELRDYARGFERLAEQMARPERQASAAEIDKLGGLRRQAQVLLAAAVSEQGSPQK